MKRVLKWMLYLPLAIAMWAHGADKNSHLGSPAQQLKAYQWNQNHSLKSLAQGQWDVLRPFSEIETTGFVAINGDDYEELASLREAIAQKLPPNVTLVVYVSDASQVAPLQADLGKSLDKDHLKFLLIPTSGDPLWARDSLPFPVYLKNSNNQSTFGLVASIYPQDFDPNKQVQNALSLPMVATGQYFRGGNLLLDLAGNCFAENVNEVASLTDPQSFFKQYFGCATVTLLDQDGGIGDIDERIKFLSNKVALTDSQVYAQQLTNMGYTVKMIPSINSNLETYMNTLIVNGTIFVPQMGISSDSDALKAYQDLGFTPVGVYTKGLADNAEGNIHCLTMNYPPGSFKESPMGKDFVEFAVNQQ